MTNRRFKWEYQRGTILWRCNYDPAEDKIGTEGRWHALTERGIRRKLARLIRRERIRDDRRIATRKASRA